MVFFLFFLFVFYVFLYVLCFQMVSSTPRINLLLLPLTVCVTLYVCNYYYYYHHHYHYF